MLVQKKWWLSFLFVLLISLGLVGFQDVEIWNVFEDFEFQDGYFTGQLDSSEFGSISIYNGKLESTISTANDFNFIPLYGEVPDNVTARVDVDLISQDLAVGAGIAFNFNSVTHDGVYFEMVFDHDFSIYAKNNDVWYYLKAFGSTDAYWTTDSSESSFYTTSAIDSYGVNSIEMVCDHGFYSVFVNGVSLGDFPAPPFELPYNGLSLFSYTYYDEGGVVQFDNFSAEERYDNSSSTSITPPASSKPIAQNQPNSDGWRYFEDFEDGEGLFKSYSADGGSYSVQYANGGLELQNNLSPSENNAYTTFDSTVQNVAIDVEVSLLYGNTSNGAQVACRGDIDGNGIYFEVDFDQEYTMYAYYNNEYYRLVDFGNENTTWSNSADSTEFLFSTNINSSTNKISIECNNGKFKFGVNGNLLQEGTYPFDFLGTDIDLLSVNQMDDNFIIRFDNFYAEETVDESISNNPINTNTTENNVPWGAYSEFSYNDGYFKEYSGDTFRIQYVNSGLEIEEDLQGKFAYTKLLSDIPVNNSIEVDVILVNGEASTRGGVSCDFYKSEDSSYGTFFYIGFDGNYYILRSHPSIYYALVNNQWVDINQSKETANPTTLIYPNDVNRIRMDCNHNKRSFYINDQLVAEYEDFEPDYSTDIVLLINTGKNSSDSLATVRFTRLLGNEIE